MNFDQQQAVLTLALFAAFADGVNNDDEREQIRRLAESLGRESGPHDVSQLYQDVLLKRVTPAQAAAVLEDPGQRQFAYEMAVGVCAVDGPPTDAERAFLTELKSLLRLDAAQSAPVERDAATVTELNRQAAPAAGSRPEPVVAAPAAVDEAALDKSILNAAILNGALELLPQSWASMAIIPLQIKMVYGIGKAYGAELDQGHIKEFIATVGVGLTSQYLEQVGRKLLGGLLGKMAGGLAGKVGGVGTGMAFSFATTYALGQVARRYYAGGRQMSTALLRETFQDLLGSAKQLQDQYVPQIQQQAGTLDAGRIMELVRGGGADAAPADQARR
jgi:uncharacterized protein (DUF697 family)/tellurite resistance protein